MLAHYLALRYLRRRRAAWLAVGTAAFSVLVPVVVMGVMQGWLEVSTINVKAAKADLTVDFPWGLPDRPETLEALAAVPGVAAVAPYIATEAVLILRNQDPYGGWHEKTLGCKVEGVDWERERALGRFDARGLHQPPGFDLRSPPLPPDQRGSGFLSPPAREHLVRAGAELLGPLGGGLLPPPPRTRAWKAGMVIGREFGFYHGLRIGEGGRLFRLYENGRKRDLAVTIADSLGTGDYELDRYTVFLSLDAARHLTGQDGRQGGGPELDGYRVRLDGSRPAEEVTAELQGLFDQRASVRSWTELSKSLLGMLTTQRRIIVVIAVCIQILCVFQIYAVFSTLVAEKRHDIGVLRALGARRSSIRNAFLIAGVTACLLGGGVGWLVGWGVLAVINPLCDQFGWSLFPQEVIYTPDTPISFDPLWPLLFLGIMAVVGLLAALIPAERAARIDPIASIRDRD